jgi:hypothetical protein
VPIGLGCEKPAIFSNSLEQPDLTTPFQPTISGGFPMAALEIGKNFDTAFLAGQLDYILLRRDDKER